MVDTDNSILQQPPTNAQPAKAILASYLLDLEVKQRQKFSRFGLPERLSTGCAEIDDLLGGGGLERGIVVGVSSEIGDGRLLSLNILASILLSHLPVNPDTSPKTIATIIDTTGTFPLPHLVKLLNSRILRARAHGDPLNDEDVKASVQKCLEMVGISRVFDVEGLWEVLGELRGSSADLATEAADVNVMNDEETQSTHREVEIANSEDEEDEWSLDPSKQAPVAATIEDEGPEIIIVDSMTQIINELLSRKEKNEAHTLLTLLSRSLTSLTKSSNILTLLHNTVIPTKTLLTTTTTNNPNYYNPPNPYDHHSRSSNLATPLFPSNAVKPALGQIFTQFPSLHLFLSHLPKTTRDAELLYGNGAENDGDVSTMRQNVTDCVILEILKDETPLLGMGWEARSFADREGRWWALDVDGGGVSFRSAFEQKGGRRGEALDREKARKVLGEKIDGEEKRRLGVDGEEGVAGAERLPGRGVSNVAKIYGFGGRRV